MVVDTGHNELEDQGGVSGMRPGETLNFAPSLSKNPHIDSIYIDKPASDYRSGDQDNYADPVEEELDAIAPIAGLWGSLNWWVAKVPVKSVNSNLGMLYNKPDGQYKAETVF